MSEETLAQWFVDNYVRKCAKLCPDNTVLLFEDMQTKAQLQNAMSKIKRWKQHGIALPHTMKEVGTFVLIGSTLSDGVSGRFNKATMLDIMGIVNVSDRKAAMLFIITQFLSRDEYDKHVATYCTTYYTTSPVC